MTDAFFGEVRSFGFTFAPVDWAFCNGAQVSDQQNPVLHAVIGNSFGSSDAKMFNLPDLQGKAVLAAGAAATGSWPFATSAGAAQVAVTEVNIPPHRHDMQIALARQLGDLTAQPQPNTRLSSYAQMAPPPAKQLSSFQTQTPNTSLDLCALAPFGSGTPQPTSNLQPFLAVNVCICTYGLWPARP